MHIRKKQNLILGERKGQLIICLVVSEPGKYQLLTLVSQDP